MRHNLSNLIINQLPQPLRILKPSIISYQSIIPRIPSSFSGIIEFSIFPKADKFDYSQPIGITGKEKVQFCNFIKSQIKNSSDCDSATWKKILTFAELWIQKGTIFNEMIKNVWFEYDLPFNSKDTPLIPSLFFSLKSGISSKSQGKISNEIISLFFGTIRATQYIQEIILTCGTNSISASVLQLGIMFP
ncbi:MAG: hypothetical protein SVY10_08340, partial [Thermodesulfobacteriota bacterium]|nr:hypothetical protein [Thermodesulfobacteriota bacterium]